MSIFEKNEYGICHLNTIPLRGEKANSSEMVSQMLFGETYQILEIDSSSGWMKVKLQFDGYEGWVHQKQYFRISKKFFNDYKKERTQILTDDFAKIHHEKYGSVLISKGAVLPFLKDDTIQLGKLKFELFASEMVDFSSFKYNEDLMVNYAKSYLHTTYLWGGRSNTGLDCSGFVQQVWRKFGINLPRDTSQQVKIGKEVEFNDIQIGDLVFFKNKKGKIVHVGLVIKDKKVIHASGSVRIDQLSEEGMNLRKRDHQIFKYETSTIKRVR